jgi:lysozyme family protein
MVSYMDLIERVLVFEQTRNSQKNMSMITNASKANFGHLFTKSLQEVEAKSPAAQKNILELDLSMPVDKEAKFKKCLTFVLEKEGSKLVLEDGGSKESSKLGILQSTARALGYNGNIKNITRNDAEKIYRKLWEQSGAASLPFPLAVVHFDSYVNSPASSKRFLEKSKGDINVYLKLREQRYVKLASAKPEVYGKYLQGWKNRITSLQSVVAAHVKANNYADNSGYPVKNG